MSYLSELDSAGFEQRNTEELRNRSEPVETGPGFFEGAIKGPAMGLMRGFVNLNDLLLTGVNSVTPTSDEDLNQQQQLRESATDFWTPNARTVGTAGRVLGGVAEGLAPLAVPFAGPALTVGSNTLAAGKRLVDAGVDSPTAGGMAALEGAATAVGLKLPILGGTLAQRLAAGAAGNLALGAGSTAAEHALLDSRGYEELAQNYDPLDGEARAVDVLSGLVFGGLHHLTVPSERDAVATVNNAKHFQKDTAPGIPAEPAANTAHQNAMSDATEQLMAGEPVNVREDVTRATFTPRPDAGNHVPEDLRALDAAQKELSDKSAAQDQTGGYDVGEGDLTDEQRAQFDRLRSGPESATPELGRTAAGGPPAAGWSEETRIRSSRTAEPLTVYRGSEQALEPGHFADEALGHASGRPSSGLGVFFTTSAEEAGRYGVARASHLDIRNPKLIRNEDLPGFDSAADARAFAKDLEAQGFDGIIIKNKHLGPGAHDWIVAFHPEQVIEPGAVAKPKAAPKAKAKAAEPVASKETEAAADDPITASVRESLATEDIKLPTGEIDADGNAVTRSARELLAEADAEVAAATETGQGIAAAVSCFLTRGA